MNENLEVISHLNQNLLSPPKVLNNFAEMKQNFPDIICYKQHPAYSDLIQSTKIVDNLKSLMIFARYSLIVLLKRITSYELIPAHLRTPRTFKDSIELFKKIIFNNYYKLFYRKNIKTGPTGEQVFQKLEYEGICVVDINAYDFVALEELALPLIQNLRNVRNQKLKYSRDFSESRTTVLRPQHKELFNAIESSFIKSGILEGISKYLGRPVQVIDVNPQINDNTDDFWRKFFSDISLDLPSTSYCHRDASGGDVKVIIYLSDVKMDNGPFSFILGSHRQRPNLLDNFIQEVNDTSGFSSSDFKSRKSFSALPACLRKKCAFGNDLQTDQDLSKQIISAEWNIVGTKGHAVVFDSKGIHRGGRVLNDERVVLTCIVG